MDNSLRLECVMEISYFENFRKVLRHNSKYFDYFELYGLKWHEYFELLIQRDMHVIGSLLSTQTHRSVHNRCIYLTLIIVPSNKTCMWQNHETLVSLERAFLSFGKSFMPPSAISTLQGNMSFLSHHA